MKLSLLRFWALCALALCTVMSTQALAAVPDAPQEANARYSWQYNAKAYVPVVYIAWPENSTGDNATSFQVYHAHGLHDTYTGFEAIGDPVPVRNTDSTDTLPNWYSLRIPMTPNDIGDHSFYVTAMNADGESTGSNIVTLSIVLEEHIVFTKYPQMHRDGPLAKVGKPFVFTAQAISSPTTDIRYSITAISGETFPSGLEIDAETGVMSWTPMNAGLYTFSLRAELANDATVSTTVIASIYVQSCISSISGIVKDEQGEIITSGVVQALMAFKRDTTNTGDTLRDTSGVYYVVVEQAAIGRDGSYTLRVKPGSYILFASGQEFSSEYYRDANAIGDAEVVAVECGEDATANMTVTRLQTFTVSGTVKRTGSGEGLVARVTFVGYNNDVPAGSRRSEYFSTVSWSNSQIGEYSISLPTNYTYIAYAEIGDTIINGGNGRIRNQIQYFDHKQDVAEATEINLTANRDNVNFDFDEAESFDNGIVGRVIDTDNSAVTAYVVAYKMGNNRAFASAITEIYNGIYELNDLQPGRYIIAAYPRDRDNILPGYYKEDEVAVPLWSDATRITVGAQSFVTGIDIVLPKAVGLPHGGGVVRGKVSNRGGSIGKGDGTVLQADALAGALVTLIDEQGVARVYDLSGNNGDFSLAELPVGTYTILIDKVGFASYKTTVIINDDTDIVLVDAALEPETVTGVDEPGVGNILLRAFPNPTTNDVTVSFFAKAGSARITVVSSTGKEVVSIRTETTAGINHTIVDTKQLSSGAYFIHVAAGNEVYTLPLHIVR